MNLSNSMFESTENTWAARRETAEPEHRNQSNSSWVFIIVLAVALGALACVGYFAVKNKNLQIAQLFGDRATLNTLGQRVDTAENTLRDVTGRWEGLAQRVTTLDGKVSRNLQQTRKYAETLTAQLHQQIRAEIEARTSVLDARLRQVESEQTAQRAQLARVEGDLRQEITSAREETGRDLSGVHQQVENNARNLDSLSQQLNPERVDFEVAKGRTTELVPGISLQISGTNNRYQRFRGSLWLLQDHRTLWLRDESVHQSVRFYHKESREPYELVVTDVTKHSVIGYLLVPARQQPAVGDPDGTRVSSSAND
jgi:flagellar basal body-associated protein FliL